MRLKLLAAFAALMTSAPICAQMSLDKPIEKPYEGPMPGPKDLVDATNPAILTRILDEAGYSATLTKDEQGEPLIQISIGKFKALVVFYQCAEKINCRSLQFYTAFDFKNGMKLKDLPKVSDALRFAKVTLDNENDPILLHDVNMQGGVSRMNFEVTAREFSMAVGKFDGFSE
jgi:hypothetical protein